MERWISELERKRFVLVTGKGGTGKSVVAAALAMRLAAEGRRVLLAELGRPRDRAFMRLNELIGVDSLAHAPRAVKNPVDAKTSFLAARLLPPEALGEYVALKLRSRKLAALVVGNRVTSTFLDTVPGLADIVCLGKLWHLLERAGEASGDAPVDTVILDAPASGHALALLHSPRNFALLAKAGPLFQDAEAMSRFVADPAKTTVVFCSLPEEVPFDEADEFDRRLHDGFQSPLVLVNKCVPLAPEIARNWKAAESDAADPKLLGAARYLRERIATESAEMERYRRRFPGAAFVPFIFPGKSAEEPAAALALEWGGKS